MRDNKQKTQQSKPRNTTIKIPITIDKPTTVHLEMRNGSIHLYDDNRNPIKIQQPNLLISRKRESSEKKGDKVILQLPLQSKKDVFIFLEQFDSIYAVDTNSQIKNNLYFSEGALAKLVSMEQTTDNSVAELSIERILTVYDLKEEYKEQKIWLLAIRKIKELEPDRAKIGLVVDCDLGKISEYNQRTLKIANQEYLPEGITLIYASSDNKDTIFNHMIAQCDAFASNNLKNRLEQTVHHDQL